MNGYVALVVLGLYWIAYSVYLVLYGIAFSIVFILRPIYRILLFLIQPVVYFGRFVAACVASPVYFLARFEVSYCELQVVVLIC